MFDVITIGDAMITFNPVTTGPMGYVNQFERKVGGAELNLAIGCARLGLKVGWISRLGNDEFGKYIRNFARGEGIDVSQVQFVDDYPTSLNFKEIMEDGDIRTFYYRNHSPTETMKADELNEQYMKQAKILHVTGVFPAIHPNNVDVFFRALELAKENGVKISFDPNIRLRMWSKERAKDVLGRVLPYVDILLAGAEEMEMIIGEREPERIVKHMEQFGTSFIAIKQGAKGSVGYANGKLIDAPAVKARKVVDTVGAGDGFNSGILYGYANNWSLKETLALANTIGSMVVGVRGDNEGLPYFEEVLQRMGKLVRIER